jgi:hypothetical protein
MRSITNKLFPMMRLKAILLVLLLQATVAGAQPIADSIKALQQRNDRIYRTINSADERGMAYSYTNVTAWRITDGDLARQIESVVRSQPFGEKALNRIDVSDILVFAAPAGTDSYEPFHILFKGRQAAEIDTSAGAGEADDPFGMFSGTSRRSGEDRYIAVKGRDVVRMMQRVPALKEAINTIQGDLYELPGDILPSGVQLVKSSYQRYIFNKMFTGYYNKNQIIDEQRRILGLPSTADEEFIPDSTITDLEITMDPDQTQALPDQAFNQRAFRYEKMVELGADRLMVNLNANNAVEVTLGSPEVGLPFTSSGIGKFNYVMRNLIGSESNVRLGLAFPIGTLGNDEFLLFPERRMSGGWGGSVDAYFAGIDFFSAFNMPLQFSATIMPSQGDNASIIYNPGNKPENAFVVPGDTIPKERTFYRTSVIGNITIPIILQLDPANFLQFGAGLGVQVVHKSFIPRESDFDTRVNRMQPEDIDLRGRTQYNQDMVGKIQDLERVSTPVTPRVSLQYVNHRSNKFGLNFLYDHLFTFGGWVEFIPNVARLEMSYTAPIVRDPKPYEPASFFFITPRIYF